MGATSTSISDPQRAFMAAQAMFFVATAPSGPDGHVNVSPKGYDTFRVLGPNEVAYLDLTGSGAETVAHLRDNGRITIMFCSFDATPMILRLYGQGEVIRPADDAFSALASEFPTHRGTRAVIRVAVDRVASSCGYAVPRLDLVGERPRLDEWAAGRSDAELVEYRNRKNTVSIDGLAALAQE